MKRSEDKPVVQYKRMCGAAAPELYGSTLVMPINHPDEYLNGEIVHTSTVVAIGNDGSFETRNTRYVLVKS